MSASAASPGRLEIKTDLRDDAAVVTLRGPVSVADCGVLRREVDALVDRPLRLIVLDLSQCHFICSLGLGAIVSAHIRLRHNRGTIRLIKPPPGVTELLTVTRLNRLFDMFENLADALAASVAPKSD